MTFDPQSVGGVVAAVPNYRVGTWIACLSAGRDRYGNALVQVVSPGHATEARAVRAAIEAARRTVSGADRRPTR